MLVTMLCLIIPEEGWALKGVFLVERRRAALLFAVCYEYG